MRYFGISEKQFEILFELVRIHLLLLYNSYGGRFSDALVFDKVKQISREKVLEKLPLGMGQVFTQGKYFCVRNMKK